MPYYIQQIFHTCQQDGCTRDARYRVYSPRNDPFGDFCLPHAEQKLKDLEGYDHACEYATRRR